MVANTAWPSAWGGAETRTGGPPPASVVWRLTQARFECSPLVVETLAFAKPGSGVAVTPAPLKCVSGPQRQGGGDEGPHRLRHSDTMFNTAGSLERISL